MCQSPISRRTFLSFAMNSKKLLEVDVSMGMVDAGHVGRKGTDTAVRSVLSAPSR
jgi:predicted RNase H-like nuclease